MSSSSSTSSTVVAPVATSITQPNDDDNAAIAASELRNEQRKERFRDAISYKEKVAYEKEINDLKQRIDVLNTKKDDIMAEMETYSANNEKYKAAALMLQDVEARLANSALTSATASDLSKQIFDNSVALQESAKRSAYLHASAEYIPDAIKQILQEGQREKTLQENKRILVYKLDAAQENRKHEIHELQARQHQLKTQLARIRSETLGFYTIETIDAMEKNYVQMTNKIAELEKTLEQKQSRFIQMVKLTDDEYLEQARENFDKQITIEIDVDDYDAALNKIQVQLSYGRTAMVLAELLRTKAITKLEQIELELAASNVSQYRKTKLRKELRELTLKRTSLAELRVKLEQIHQEILDKEKEITNLGYKIWHENHLRLTRQKKVANDERIQRETQLDAPVESDSDEIEEDDEEDDDGDDDDQGDQAVFKRLRTSEE